MTNLVRSSEDDIVGLVVTLADNSRAILEAITLVDANGDSVITANGQRIQGNSAAGAADAGDPVKVGGRYDSTLPTLTNGQRGNLQLSPRGTLLASLYDYNAGFTFGIIVPTNVTQAPGSNGAIVTASYNYGYDGANWARVGGDAAGWWTVPKPATTGGLSIARLVGSAGANIKASAGQLYGGTVTNSNAAIRYLHLYNKASAATLSTDTPVATIPLPPNASVMVDCSSLGAAFATGISWAFTTDDITIPTTAGATTDIHGTLFYK